MKNALEHSGTSTVIQFPRNPARGNADGYALSQVQGFDSSGNFFSYYRNKVKTQEYILIFERCTPTIISALVTFLQARNGDKSSFTWYDHESAAHTVKFTTGRLKYVETNPGFSRAEFSLYEEL